MNSSVAPLKTASATLRADGLRLARDRFLVGTGLYIIGISVAMRWVIPWVTPRIEGRWGVDLTPYYALIVSHIVVQLASILVGILGAFLLLESREDRTIKALLVSPLPLSTYLWWLGCAMVLTSAALTVVEGLIIGLGLPSYPALVATGMVGALTAPLIALAVAGLASNKTEAFAYLKIIGVAPLLLSGTYFLAEPIQWVAAVYPPYWAVKAYWVAEAGGRGWAMWLLGGGLVASIWIAWSVRLFARSARS
jgi:fluoroquinolone transport system permease protein